MNISIIIPSRNNLKYLKSAYTSLRKHTGSDHEIIMLDDASTDGTWEWLQSQSVLDPNIQIYRHSGSERIGHTYLYDIGVSLIKKNSVFGIFHADMIATPNYISNAIKHLKGKTVVCSTRIEPPLHPGGVEKIVKDFGLEPELFKESEFLSFVKTNETIHKDKITHGVFAPWFMYVDDFKQIGGHDKKLFAPMELEDSLEENRIITIVEHDITLIRLKDLFQKYEHLSETTDNGKQIINFEKHGVDIRSSTAKKGGIIGLSKIKKIIRHETSKKMLKVSTTWGETICTEDHSLIDFNLNPITPDKIDIKTLWRPVKFSDWTHKFYKNKIDFNDFLKDFISPIGKGKCNYKGYLLPIIENTGIDNVNIKLRNICEFLGFFVAEGSVSENRKYFSFCNNNIDVLNEFMEKSKSLFGNIKYTITTSKKENCKDVFSYRKGSLQLSHLLSILVGVGSKNKKVPEFIFNLPKPYQQSFLYGYLQGDGYLGTNISKDCTDENICVNKKLIFKRKIFELLDCKFTTKSDMLAAGICFLLRNNYPKLSVNINFDKNKEVYNMFTSHSIQNRILKIEPSDSTGKYVYDLEMSNYGEHTFIDSLGCFGVHNSDVFNRFSLAGYNLIQSRDSFVYHMTCRGSRFKDGIQIEQIIPLANGNVWNKSKDSDEYTKLRNIKFKEWWRKWHMNVLHTDDMLPIVYKKYDIGYIIHNCSRPLLNFIEPWSDKVYVSDQSLIDSYCNDEQQYTQYSLKHRLTSNLSSVSNDIIIEFDGNKFTNNHTEFIVNLSQIIESSGEIGEMQFDIFKLNIKSLQSYEHSLIHNDEFYNSIKWNIPHNANMYNVWTSTTV